MATNPRADRPNREVREWRLDEIAVRAADDESTIRSFHGHASIVDAPYTLRDAFGEFTETIAPGAFTRTLKANPDVAFLTNHGGLTMARTAAGTLRLSEDDQGLVVEADLDTARSDVRDVTLALARRDIDQMSFAFRVEDDDWNDDYTERTINEVNLQRGDVSVVNFGANPFTDAALRSLRLDGVDDTEFVSAVVACRAGDGTPADRRLIARAIEALRPLTIDEAAVGRLAALAQVRTAEFELDELARRLAS